MEKWTLRAARPEGWRRSASISDVYSRVLCKRRGCGMEKRMASVGLLGDDKAILFQRVFCCEGAMHQVQVVYA